MISLDCIGTLVLVKVTEPITELPSIMISSGLPGLYSLSLIVTLPSNSSGVISSGINLTVPGRYEDVDGGGDNLTLPINNTTPITIGIECGMVVLIYIISF